MWTTIFKHREGVVEEMIHDFGNNVRVVSNLEELTVKRMHGEVCVKEYTLDPQVGYYVQFLNCIAEEMTVGEKI